MKNLYNLLGGTTHKTREAVQSYGSSFGKVTVILFLFLFSLNKVNAQCTHTIQLTDTYGDGWNGGAVSVSVNGTVVLTNITLGSGFGPASYNFTASSGQTIRVYTTIAGSWAGERRIRVVNNAGVDVIALVGVANGTATSGGRTGTASCAVLCAQNSLTLTMNDSWGDGWNGGSITLTNDSGGSYGPYSITGASGTQALCLPDGCYSINQVAGSYPGEITWSLSNGVSGNGNYGNQSNVFTLGSGSCGAVSGCMDPSSVNYNPIATIDDGSCFYGVPSSGSISLTTCSATLYDNGGPSGNYATNSNGITTIYPGTPGQNVSINFSSFDLETCCDNLKIYNGNSTASTLIGTFATNPGVITSSAADGSLTLQFYSDGSIEYTGFVGVISCVSDIPGCMDPASDNYNPAATVDDGSCVYLCASATALSCGTASNYTNAAGTGSWNSLGGPFGTPGTEQLFTYTPTTTGNYTISVTSNAWNDLYYSTSCGSTGWTYVDDISGSATNTLALTGGTTYYFLLDPEGTAGVTGTITASCYTPPAWTDAWVSMNTGSSNWCAGETRTISVTVTNTGSSTWTDATPDINIGVKWNAEADYFIRTDAGGLAPGATQTYNLTVTAPLTLGSNNLTFDIVNEFNFWFADNTNGGGPGNVVYTSPAITIVGSPTMNAGADQSVCQASSITLTDAGTGSTSVSWSNGVSNGVAFSAPSSTTTYIVTGTNAAGCTATDQVVVTIKPLPVVNAGADQTVCQGVIANLTGTVTGGSCIMSLTTSGGSFASEKWVNITTAANGGGTVVWAQGNGTIGNASGLLTNQSIDLSSYLGQTLYLNTYDSYADGWDGSVYNLSLNGTTVVNNAGVSPSNGTDADASGAWESIAAEMETSEAFTVPGLTYAWTSSPAGFTSSSLTAVVSPTQTTTYTLSSTYDGCTGSDVVTVTLPTAGSALAQDNESATCQVNQNGWVHFYHSSGRLIASVNSQGQDLGAVTATSYVEGAPVSVDACTSSNPIYATTVMGRHWVITPTNQPTSAVLVRLPYENTEFSDLTSAASTNANSNDDLLTPSDLGLSKYSNGTNANVNDVASDNCGVGATTFHTQTGNGAASSYSTVNASYADFSIPGFSEFWLHGSAQSSPLPVELVNFQANCAGEGKVNVTWATASEHNSANFTVEKSRDGMNWTVMASLAGAGNSTQMINYSTVDNNAASGVNYYRLTQTDFDGASETFNIASANCGDNSPLTTVKVYPNPSAGDFYIDFNSEEIVGSSVISITDARGMEVYKMNVTVEKGSNVFHIENMEAAPGIYYIQVSNGTATSNIVKHSLR